MTLEDILKTIDVLNKTIELCPNTDCSKLAQEKILALIAKITP